MRIYFYSLVFIFFKQNTAYELRFSDWSSDVCSSDLLIAAKSKSIQIRHDVRQPRRRHIIEMLERGKRHLLARTIACRHRVQSDPRFGKGLQIRKGRRKARGHATLRINVRTPSSTERMTAARWPRSIPASPQ